MQEENDMKNTIGNRVGKEHGFKIKSGSNLLIPAR